MKTKNRIYCAMLVLLGSGYMYRTSAQTVPLVFDVENRGASCTKPTVALKANTKLPDPFEWSNGSGRISTMDEWSCRRNEIKTELEAYEIGPKPVRPSKMTATYTGGTLTVVVTENGQTLTLTSKVTMPTGTGPFPVVIGMNSPTGGLGANLFNGIIQIPFNHDQVVNYNMNSSQVQTDPYYKIFPALWGKIGNYSAWSWGISRLIDGLEIVKAQMNADVSKIAVTGCSYAGKMALFAGALDERIALTIVQESGGGGINSWRYSKNFSATTGTSVEKIDNTNYSWFMPSMKNLNPDNLPHDHHELIAMIAPRPVLILGNPDMVWLCDESGYVTAMNALEVWKSMGVPERFGFDFAKGHSHCAASTSQNTNVTKFVDRYLRMNSSVNTDVKASPFANINDASWRTWTTPVLKTADPQAPVVSIVSPSANVVFATSSSIAVAATVADADNNVVKVEILVDDVKVSELTASPYQFSLSDLAAGSHTITVKATDAKSLTGSASVTVSLRAPQAPYGGAAHPIPGTIQFEAFDTGGQDSAYHDSSPGSSVTPAVNFRPDEDVDIEECKDTDGGYNLGYTAAGEWLEYTVQVAQAGTYSIDLRVACSGAGRTLSMKMGNTVIASDLAIPNTSGWQTWTTVTVPDVVLASGTQILRVSIGATDYINLNYMKFNAMSVIADNCPDDPSKTEPGHCGCGIPEGSCPAQTGIKLRKGWNLIGYTGSAPESVSSALSSVWKYVETVKNEDSFYIKGYAEHLNLLQELEWGNGYFIKLSADCELIW